MFTFIQFLGYNQYHFGINFLFTQMNFSFFLNLEIDLKYLGIEIFVLFLMIN